MREVIDIPNVLEFLLFAHFSRLLLEVWCAVEESQPKNIQRTHGRGDFRSLSFFFDSCSSYCAAKLGTSHYFHICLLCGSCFERDNVYSILLNDSHPYNCKYCKKANGFI